MSFAFTIRHDDDPASFLDPHTSSISLLSSSMTLDDRLGHADFPVPKVADLIFPTPWAHERVNKKVRCTGRLTSANYNACCC
jgi:hypothetical protein